ncbi:MAG: YjgN family protein [Pseudomonadota bacterium]
MQQNNITSPSGGQPLSFQFTGSGFEYFKIWIVNLCLTVITLGIYSAWAKVRRNRYFYGNTQLAGDAFEYLANPISILKGRLIAVAFFVALSMSQHFSVMLYGILILVFLVLFPWILVRALVFRARNTAFRNIRFTFRGTYGQAFLNFLLLPALPAIFIFAPMFLFQPNAQTDFTPMLVSAGVGLLLVLAFAPYFLYRQKRWFIDNSGFGTDRFDFDARVIDYYKVFGVMLLMILALGGVFALFGGIAMASLGGKAGGDIQATVAGYWFLGMAAFYLVVLVIYGFIFAYANARFSNIMFCGTRIDGHQFEADLSAWGLFKVYLINLLGIIFTLGLFIPWAKVNIARYMADHVYLIPNGDLDRFVADQQSAVAAVGEEMGEMFDIDIGL